MARPQPMESALEMRARQAAFAWLDRKAEAGQGTVSRDELASFSFEGEALPLLDRGRGIRNPEAFRATLSVMTSFDSPYADEEIVGGLFKYHYQREDGGDNRKLQIAALDRTPLIYFKGIRAGVFVPFYPVFAFDSPEDRTFLLAIGEDLRLLSDAADLVPPQRAYVERLARQRLHQPQFRASVLFAYSTRCAVCTLAHARLLDAAHIWPDSSERGVPSVSNGIALCKIHHAAYDQNMMGFSPDYRVHVSESLLEERDGPMLLHGLQEMDGRFLSLPSRTREQPNRDALAERFRTFLSVGDR